MIWVLSYVIEWEEFYRLFDSLGILFKNPNVDSIWENCVSWKKSKNSLGHDRDAVRVAKGTKGNRKVFESELTFSQIPSIRPSGEERNAELPLLPTSATFPGGGEWLTIGLLARSYPISVGRSTARGPTGQNVSIVPRVKNSVALLVHM